MICRPCSRKWRVLSNIGNFEGLAFGVYLGIYSGNAVMASNIKLLGGKILDMISTTKATRTTKSCLVSLELKQEKSNRISTKMTLTSGSRRRLGSN